MAGCGSHGVSAAVCPWAGFRDLKWTADAVARRLCQTESGSADDNADLDPRELGRSHPICQASAPLRTHPDPTTRVAATVNPPCPPPPAAIRRVARLVAFRRADTYGVSARSHGVCRRRAGAPVSLRRARQRDVVVVVATRVAARSELVSRPCAACRAGAPRCRHGPAPASAVHEYLVERFPPGHDDRD
jgi:hypothetical protein